ncbi:hypothetical protein [Natrinema salsiterrestre]|uniref:Uncharacterized protein n=1 Tax=Natrinema salsiterrestre TaxID=2950540 RepID=A0A9Q4Q3T7_9EURY|nr:hypothetical protein [Natrinema salsiterrestre]MDF9746552.1 hypothetical protein [Natrinema salsiterrestre]
MDDSSSGIAERSRITTGAGERWLFLEGNRFAIAAAVAAAFGTFFLALTMANVAPLTDPQPLFYAFSALISGNLTLITVVASINQLLLSRELQSPGELQSEIEATVEFRRDVEAVTNRAAPAEPSGFLRLVVESARQDAQRLGGTAAGTLPAEVYDEVEDIVAELTDEFDRIDELIQESDTGIFNTLSTMLGTNFAYEIRRLEEVRQAHDASLTEETNAAIDDILDRLRELDIARQYFKSVYLQVELSRLSRYLFYAGLPAVGVVIATLFVLSVSDPTRFGQSVRVVLFPIVVTVGTLPLSLLFSYILRLMTVTERTAAITPFTTPEQED